MESTFLCTKLGCFLYCRSFVLTCITINWAFVCWIKPNYIGPESSFHFPVSWQHSRKSFDAHSALRNWTGLSFFPLKTRVSFTFVQRFWVPRTKKTKFTLSQSKSWLSASCVWVVSKEKEKTNIGPTETFGSFSFAVTTSYKEIKIPSCLRCPYFTSDEVATALPKHL